MVDMREQLCMKTLINLQVNDERKGTSNVRIIFIVPFPFLLAPRLGWGAVTSGLPDLVSSSMRTTRETAALDGESDPTRAHWVWASSQVDAPRTPELEALGFLSSSQYHPQLVTKGEGRNLD